jgi:hypothetical protein
LGGVHLVCAFAEPAAAARSVGKEGRSGSLAAGNSHFQYFPQDASGDMAI